MGGQLRDVGTNEQVESETNQLFQSAEKRAEEECGAEDRRLLPCWPQHRQFERLVFLSLGAVGNRDLNSLLFHLSEKRLDSRISGRHKALSKIISGGAWNWPLLGR